MKKLLSMVLVVLMFSSLAVLSVTAEEVEITDDFLNAVREEYSDETIQKDEIYIEYMKDLGNNTYLVKYGAGDYAYPDDMVEIGLGSYTLTTSRPVPVLYAFGKMYDLEYAYENMLIGDRELQMMLTFEELHMEKTKITKELKHAKYGYQDEDYIFVRFTLDGSEKWIDDYENYIDDISGSYEKLKAHYEELHQRLLSEVLNGYEYQDMCHNNGISIVGIKKKDLKAISESEFVVLMDYVSEVQLAYIDTYNLPLTEYKYKEVYECYDENGELSYVLLNAHRLMCAEACCSVRVGDVIVWSSSIYSDFTYQYGLYDVTEGEFYDIFDVRKTPEKYYKLEENLIKYAGAYRVGDSDGDGQLSILDATKIQMYLASLDRLEYFDHGITHKDSEESYVSDVDNDGEVSIMDATAIQLKLANR